MANCIVAMCGRQPITDNRCQVHYRRHLKFGELKELKLDPEYEHLRWEVSYFKRGYAYVYHRGRNIALHRLIIGDKEGLECDHINRDRQDNRKSNLRHVSRQENLANRSGWGKSYLGVYFDKSKRRTKPWKASIKSFGKTLNVGYFESPEEAREAVKNKKKELGIWKDNYGHR